MQNTANLPHNHNILLNQGNDGEALEEGGGIEMASLKAFGADPRPQGRGREETRHSHSENELERSNWKKWTSASMSACSSLTSSVTATGLLHRNKLLLILLVSVAGLLVAPFIDYGTHFRHSKVKSHNRNDTTNSRGWEEHTVKMEKKREGHGAVLLDPNRILITGGRNDGGFRVLDSAEIIDISRCIDEGATITSTTTTIPALISARSDHASAQINGYAFAIGGHDGHQFLKSVERLKIQRNKNFLLSMFVSKKKENMELWETVEELNQERGGCAASVHKNDIFVFGGEGETGKTLSTVEYLHTTATAGSSSGGWSVIEGKMKVPRFKHAAVTVGDQIYIIGGRDNLRNTIDSVEIFDTVTKSFQDGPTLPLPISHMSASVVMGKFIVITGGDTTNYRAIGESYILDTSVPVMKQKWKVIENGTLQTARFGHTAMLINGSTIYVSGGSEDTSYNALDTIESIYILDFIL